MSTSFADLGSVVTQGVHGAGQRSVGRVGSGRRMVRLEGVGYGRVRQHRLG